MVGELGSSGFLIFLAVIAVAAATIWLIFDLLSRSDKSIGTKAVWMVLAVLYHLLTIVVYVLFFRTRKHPEP